MTGNCLTDLPFTETGRDHKTKLQIKVQRTACMYVYNNLYWMTLNNPYNMVSGPD